MADSILLVLWVWLALQLPLALLIGAVIRRGRGTEAFDDEVKSDIRPVRAA